MKPSLIALVALVVSAPVAQADPVDCYNIAMDGLTQSKALAGKEAEYNSAMAKVRAGHDEAAHDLLNASNAARDVLLPVIAIRMKEASHGCVPADQAKQKAALIEIGNTEAQTIETVKFKLIAAGVK